MTLSAAWRAPIAAALVAAILEGLYLTEELRKPLTGIVLVSFALAVIAVGYLRGRWTAVPLGVACVFAPILIWLAIVGAGEGNENGPDLEGMDYVDSESLSSILVLPLLGAVLLTMAGVVLRAATRRISRHAPTHS